MKTGVEMLPVEQSDREAVQAFHRLRLNKLMEAIKDEKAGARLGEDEGDAGDLVQAFARHRLDHTHPAATGSVREALSEIDNMPHYWPIREAQKVAGRALAAAPTPDAAASDAAVPAGEVKQADRDAARALVALGGTAIRHTLIRHELADDGPTVQAFARHRLATTPKVASDIEARLAAMSDALSSIREHCRPQPSALATAIVATCDAALAAAPKVASDTCPFCTGASEYQGSPEDAFCERHLRLYRKANAA